MVLGDPIPISGLLGCGGIRPVRADHDERQTPAALRRERLARDEVSHPLEPSTDEGKWFVVRIRPDVEDLRDGSPMAEDSRRVWAGCRARDASRAGALAAVLGVDVALDRDG
jgi:hypothetical protein